MDYGNTALLGSTDPLKRPSTGGVGANVRAQEREQDKPAKRAAAAGVIACDIKHPLAAILANATAARRWLNRPDANLAETMTALERIVKDVARVDAAIDGIRAALVEDIGEAGLT
jgi:hypothetical protein